MYEFAPVLGTALDRGIRPVLRFLHLKLGVEPNQVTWSSFWASVAAGIGVGAGGALGRGLTLWRGAGAGDVVVVLGERRGGNRVRGGPARAGTRLHGHQPGARRRGRRHGTTVRPRLGGR